jgi:hypothetical protein
MAKKGRYCKAYPISQLREYSNWTENTQNLRKEEREIDGKKVEVPRELTDTDFFYLQEDFVVTDDIFIDEHIVFADVTPEWIDFCKNTLKFEVPVYESIAPPAPDGAGAQATS